MRHRRGGDGRSRRDGGETLAAVVVSIVLFGVTAMMATEAFSRGAGASRRARSHAEATAVLAWETAAVRSDPLACDGTTRTVTVLGPDDLSTPEGFSVLCELQPLRCWPAPPSGGGPAPPSCAGWQIETEPMEVTVAWTAAAISYDIANIVFERAP